MPTHDRISHDAFTMHSEGIPIDLGDLLDQLETGIKAGKACMRRFANALSVNVAVIRRSRTDCILQCISYFPEDCVTRKCH
jgi:hypothetical protein